MRRLLFEKTGNAVWMSHLDLMRLFQRAFKRAGLPLTHTQGFNPRPSVSIALPLSVGTDSICELLDFELDGISCSCEEIHQKLNDCLVEGVRVLQVYDNGRKIKELSFLQCDVYFEYDDGVPQSAQQQLTELFGREEVVVSKKTKNGVQEQNIIPMIRKINVSAVDHNTVGISALICCQNPSLNPSQLAAAVDRYLPALSPNFVRCSRREVLDQNYNVFR